ncbi:hypothetical protein M9H77_29804 [Catharanthus roseus]|uniref:Uncharacterized protein n=1 Tax=Catharanthus roseus TaxID=4058 RepID=A0ACB9ZVG2_CATRO|nr:hypothetical protein M9H77_29804 [Catharanthus roseus]
MYHELEKITKKNKELKDKIDNLSNENSKLVCENKTLLESLEVVKKESDSSKLEFEKLILENNDLCEKVFSFEKCMVDYDDLKKKKERSSHSKIKALKTFKTYVLVRDVLRSYVFLIHRGFPWLSHMWTLWFTVDSKLDDQ